MSKNGFAKNVIALAVAAVIVISGSAVAFYFIVEKGPTDQAVKVMGAGTKDTVTLAHAIGGEVRKTFGFTPQITVSEHVVVEQNVPAAELATVQRHLVAEITWSHEWMQSTKSLDLRGVFLAKAGFDFKKSSALMRIIISESGKPIVPEKPVEKQNRKRIRVDFPAPQLLSLERTDFHILKDESGWWNKISDRDRESAEKELKTEAREQALAAGILNDAKKNLVGKLQPILKKFAGKNAVIEFHFGDESPSPHEFSASPEKPKPKPPAP